MEKSTPTINQFIAYVKFGNSFPDSLRTVEKIGELIIEKLNLTAVHKSYHKFIPGGITLIYILSQSHLIVHTWPEYNMIHFDLFSCDNISKDQLIKTMNSIFTKDKRLSLIVKKVQNLTE